MKFAVVPTIDEYLEDRFISTFDDNGNEIFRDKFAEEFAGEFRKRGDELHTLDMYKDWREVDCIFLDWPRWSWIARLSKAGVLDRTIYCNAEPTSVIPENCPEGYKKLSKIFPYILTWNDDWVDNVNIFKKNIPYRFVIDFGEKSFAEKKLVTAITANKSSKEAGELYSERKRVYEYFEKNHPEEFDFYGFGWDANEHPGYKGHVDSKIKIYQNYRFVVCLENTAGLRDYVTEKIYDCLCAGVIPIYGGSYNVDEYVPKNCYIDYFSFESYEQMYEYINNMTEIEYNKYRDSIKEWLEKTDHSELSTERYVDYLYEVAFLKKSFSLKKLIKVYIWIRGAIEEIRNVLVDVKHRIGI